MARKVQIILTDDLTNEESADINTVTFALDGTAYEIDLTEKNAEAMRDEFSRYVQAARKVGKANVNTRQASNRAKATANANTGTDVDGKAVRAWAEKEGLMPEGRKGRVPSAIVDQYLAAQKGEQTTIPAPAKVEKKAKATVDA